MTPLSPSPALTAPDTETDFYSDDLGFDLSDLSGMAGFLMNEAPDSSGHFYPPPWATEPEPLVKEEPMMLSEPDPSRSQLKQEQQHQQQPQPPPQQQQQQRVPTRAAPALDTWFDVPISGASITSVAKRPPKSQQQQQHQHSGCGGGGAGAGATLRKTPAGGITRRRSSSKEEQAKKRRERNRVLARRTRLRKKFFFQSLQQQVWSRAAGGF